MSLGSQELFTQSRSTCLKVPEMQVSEFYELPWIILQEACCRVNQETHGAWDFGLCGRQQATNTGTEGDCTKGISEQSLLLIKYASQRVRSREQGGVDMLICWWHHSSRWRFLLLYKRKLPGSSLICLDDRCVRFVQEILLWVLLFMCLHSKTKWGS